MSEQAECAGCGTRFNDPEAGSTENREPCPSCGSTKRVQSTSAHLGGKATITTRLTLIRAWHGITLTLFGLAYAILVAIAGVVVAMVGTEGSWLWWGIYAATSVLVFALAMLVFPQAIIASMRWLIERAKKAPPWPG